MSGSRRGDSAKGDGPVSAAPSAAGGGRQVTPELLARYDRPGPRYTSYPTAVEFDDAVDADVYDARLLAADAHAQEPFSVYVHLPFCEHRCWFCGCNVIISPDKEVAVPYLDLLRRELDMVAERLHDRRGLGQLHLGGGTPTYYSPDQLRALIKDVFAVFKPIAGAELAVEVDPRVTGEEHLAALAEFGFNRVSMGVQDFTPKVQEAIARVQSVEKTAALVEAARKHGYSGINIDLIYGLPYQNVDAFGRAVDLVIDMGVDRAAVYSFAFLPSMRGHGHMKGIDPKTLPERDEKFALFARARERFLECGYEAIGMDHFAKPEDELAVARREGRLRRNFQGYSVVPTDDVLGLGISAIGDLQGAYVQNHKKISGYRAALEADRLPVERGVVLSEDDRVRRKLIQQLMCNGRIDIRAFEDECNVTFREYFRADLALLEEHEREGLVRTDAEFITATPLGEAFVRNLAMCFDRYLREKHADDDQIPFSRTV